MNEKLKIPSDGSEMKELRGAFMDAESAESPGLPYLVIRFFENSTDVTPSDAYRICNDTNTLWTVRNWLIMHPIGKVEFVYLHNAGVLAHADEKTL